MVLKIGMIGTDSSHCVMFTRILNDKAFPFSIEGGKVTHVVRYCSEDFFLSYSREPKFSEILQNELNVKFVELDELANEVDAILLVAADGRVHLPLFEKIVKWGKPVFIDKPLAIGTKDAEDIIRLAQQYHVSMMSSSSLRFSTALKKRLQSIDFSKLKKVIVHCPLNIEVTQLRYFWYGIHGVEILYSMLGVGCSDVRLEFKGNSENIVGVWENGVIGEVHCIQDFEHFEVIVETDEQTYPISLHDDEHDIPYYVSLVEHIISFFNGQTYISDDEMLEVISFIEQAEQHYTTLKG